MRNKPSLTLGDVKKMLAACEAEAVKNKWNVVDRDCRRRRHLLGFQRMDGAARFPPKWRSARPAPRP